MLQWASTYYNEAFMKILAFNHLKFGHSDQEKLLHSFLTKQDGFKFALKCDPKGSNHILLERICLLGPTEINFTFSYTVVWLEMIQDWFEMIQ